MPRSLSYLRWIALLVWWSAPPLDAETPSASPGAAAASSTAVADFPASLVRFASDTAQPVFQGSAGQWDAKIRERGWILRDATGYRLWYTGYDGTRQGERHLGLATSPDGIQWTRRATAPLLPQLWIEDMMVVPAAGKYWMFAEGRGDQAQLLSSENGDDWTLVGPLDIRQASGEPITPGPYGTPTAWFENDRWYLFYERMDRGVWLASSGDMKVWTHVQDAPVLEPGPAAYDRDMIALNQIIKREGRYFAYYHGCATTPGEPNLWCTCIAMSTDLVHWEKYAQNPLLPVADNKSSGVLVDDGQQLRLYTMHSEVHVHWPCRSIAPGSAN